MTTKLLSIVAVLAVVVSAGTASAAGEIRNDKNRIVGYTQVQPVTADAAKGSSFDLGAGVKSLLGTAQSPAPAHTKVVNDKNRILAN